METPNFITMLGILGSWSILMSSFFVFVVKALIAAEIKKLNGTYRRAPECQLIMNPVIDKLNHLEMRMDRNEA